MMMMTNFRTKNGKKLKKKQKDQKEKEMPMGGINWKKSGENNDAPKFRLFLLILAEFWLKMTKK